MIDFSIWDLKESFTREEIICLWFDIDPYDLGNVTPQIASKVKVFNDVIIKAGEDYKLYRYKRPPYDQERVDGLKCYYENKLKTECCNKFGVTEAALYRFNSGRHRMGVQGQDVINVAEIRIKVEELYEKRLKEEREEILKKASQTYEKELEEESYSYELTNGKGEVSREALRRYAESINHKPLFLFKEERGKSESKGSDNNSFFPAPEGTKWKQVEFKITAEAKIMITVKGKSKAFNKEELKSLGLKNHLIPLLFKIIYKKGLFDRGSIKDQHIRQNLSKLRAWLKETFEINEDPIIYNDVLKSYKTAFTAISEFDNSKDEQKMFKPEDNAPEGIGNHYLDSDE